MEILIVLLIVILVVLVFTTFKTGKRILEGREKEHSFLLLQEEIHNLRQELNQQVSSIASQMLENQKSSGEREKEVSQKLGEVFEATRRIFDVAKDISSLQDILQAPKLRGGMGELLLSQRLKEILPNEFYQEQYTFSTGATVDAIIKLKGGLVPVDAKFPLEPFNKMLGGKDDEEKKSARKAFVKAVKKHNFINTV